MDDHNALYHLALLGDFPEATADAVKAEIAERIKQLGLKLGKDVSLDAYPLHRKL